MPTMTFKIGSGGSQHDFTVVSDNADNLVSITAVDAEQFVYDCLLQLMPQDSTRAIKCCRPTTCMSGMCSEAFAAG